ncbi:MAG TPA: PAS domain S-box protein [Burkholderiales bacterium]|nr:PAS domain S-box protein [Burkholderiales bacterium]
MEEGLYRLIVEQTKDYAVFALDATGHVRTWNLGAARIKGYAPAEIIGRHFSTFYPQEAIDRGWPDYELQVAAREGRFEDEGWRLRKDGSRFWASVIITALRDEGGGLLGFSKITRDLTERKMNEEALRQSEERFRLLVEGVADYAIYMIDPEGIVSSWNVGAERIKGYAREEIIGKHFSRFYTHEDRAAGRPWEELRRARQEGRIEDQGWRVRKNGERFWARLVVSAVYDGEGRLRGFAKVTHDMTQQRHVQDLEKAARNVNEFIAMLAHELRNPLAPIVASAHAMEQLPLEDARQRDLQRTISRQAGQLSRIVDDMLDIARITRGALALKRSPLDVTEAVRRALEAVRPEIEARGHALEVEAPPGLWVDGDLHRLTQLLTNLLNNAARYTPPGGRISVSARAEGPEVAVRVSDNGRGIAPELLGRVFDMFVQGRAPIERVDGGLGIGLALARRIAELHDGSLTAASGGEGRGAELTLRLPASPAAPAAAEPLARPALLKRVLVVDDNEDASASLAMLLQSLGHETAVAKDGAQALELARSFAPDIVLLDIGMPGMDGYEVARRLRAMDAPRALRVVAVTGWAQEADRARALAAGFDLHLVKPLDPPAIAAALGEGATRH